MIICTAANDCASAECRSHIEEMAHDMQTELSHLRHQHAALQDELQTVIAERDRLQSGGRARSTDEFNEQVSAPGRSVAQARQILFPLMQGPCAQCNGSGWQRTAACVTRMRFSGQHAHRLQVQRVREETEQEHRDNLAALSRLTTSKIASYRRLLTTLSLDVQAQLAHVHQDQGNTIKRILYRIQQVRPHRCCKWVRLVPVCTCLQASFLPLSDARRCANVHDICGWMQALLRQQEQPAAAGAMQEVEGRMFAAEEQRRAARREVDNLKAQRARVAAVLCEVTGTADASGRASVASAVESAAEGAAAKCREARQLTRHLEHVRALPGATVELSRSGGTGLTYCTATLFAVGDTGKISLR
jgi:uncharacterized protein YdcH (DUF465 family)